MSLYLTYLILKLRNSDACFWSVRKALAVSLGSALSPSLSSLPLSWSVSFVCLHYTSSKGHSVSAQWELAISEEAFPALLFRLKSLQSSIATWIRKKKGKKLAHYYSQNHLNVKRGYLLGSPPTPLPPPSSTPAHLASFLSKCVSFTPKFSLHGPDSLILFKLSIQMQFFLLVLNIFTLLMQRTIVR